MSFFGFFDDQGENGTSEGEERLRSRMAGEANKVIGTLQAKNDIILLELEAAHDKLRVAKVSGRSSKSCPEFSCQSPHDTLVP